VREGDVPRAGRVVTVLDRSDSALAVAQERYGVQNRSSKVCKDEDQPLEPVGRPRPSR
jgi:hypothetical protein